MNAYNNRYGNEYGCHTPKETKETLMTLMSKTDLDWEDNSWHNDMCDNLYYEIVCNEDEHKFISLYLPNSANQDANNEEWNTYTLFNEEQDTLISSTNLDEIIRYINNNYALGGTLCRNGKPIDECNCC